MKMTVNEAMVNLKILRTRSGQLEAVKNESTKRVHRLFGKDDKQTEEPTYDIKKVDAKIVKINKALLDIEKAIKQSNAITSIDIEKFDFDDLNSGID